MKNALRVQVLAICGCTFKSAYFRFPSLDVPEKRENLLYKAIEPSKIFSFS